MFEHCYQHRVLLWISSSELLAELIEGKHKRYEALV